MHCSRRTRIPARRRFAGESPETCAAAPDIRTSSKPCSMRPQRSTKEAKMLCRTSPEVGGMGHSIKRKEDLRFIQGRGNYVDDVHLPDMVYGHMVRSPYAHARLKSINTEKALQLPGVLAVITGEDLAKANLAWMPTLFFDKQMVLATGKVLFQSQEVAFVVAEDP